VARPGKDIFGVVQEEAFAVEVGRGPRAIDARANIKSIFRRRSLHSITTGVSLNPRRQQSSLGVFAITWAI
jgi:hypothetical protein